MARSRKRRGRRSLLGLLLLLLFLLLFKLNPFLAGFLPGGGRWEDQPEPDPIQQGVLEILIVGTPNRAPVQGATVQIAGLDGDRRNTASDAQGKAKFEGLNAQPYRIDASGDGGEASAWSVPGKSITMEMRAQRMRTGHVRGIGGNPVEGTVVLLDRDARILAEDELDRDGQYRLPDHPDAASVCAWPKQDFAPSAVASGDIVVGEGERVRGRIPIHGTEKPLDVFALVPDRTEDKLVPLRVQWNMLPDGTYAGRLPRNARAWIAHDGTTYPVGVTTALREQGSITGVVNDIGKRPLAGIAVSARPLREGLPVSPFPVESTVRTGPDGRFTIEALGHGSYALELSAPGRARVMIHEAATGAAPVTIVMTRGFRIRGRVLDPDGKPIAGAEVFALGTPDPDTRFPEAATKTTSDGRFVIDRLGGDFARVRVRKEGFQDVTMMKAVPDANVTIRLRRAP